MEPLAQYIMFNYPEKKNHKPYKRVVTQREGRKHWNLMMSRQEYWNHDWEFTIMIANVLTAPTSPAGMACENKRPRETRVMEIPERERNSRDKSTDGNESSF